MRVGVNILNFGPGVTRSPSTIPSPPWPGMAGQTRRVQLGTTVCVLPYRHPILTARLAANIDALSGGRFIFGVGVGNPNSRLEAEAMGVPFHRRGAMPAPIIKVLRDTTRQAVEDPAFRAALEKLSSPPAYQDADEFKPWLDADAARLADIIKKIGKVE